MLTSLNPRQRTILAYLLDQDGPAAASHLAKRYGTSLRTIRYDLEAIRTVLKGTGVTLEAKPRTGMWLEGPVERREALRTLLRTGETEAVQTPAAREDRLLLELLSRNGVLTYQEVCDLLACSRTTVVRDLAGVERRLKAQGLRLERVRGGVSVSGSERECREALVRLLVETVGPADLTNALRGAVPLPPSPVSNPGPKVNLSWDELAEIVKQAEHGLGRKLTDESFGSLVVHLAVGIQRLVEGRRMTMPSARLAELRALPEWPLAVEMAVMLQARTGLTLPEAEVGYLVLHLAGSRSQSLGKAGEPPASSKLCPQAILLAERLMQRTGELLEIDLAGDHTLRDGLAWHLQGLLARQRFRMQATNPLRAEIREQMGRIYRAVAQALEEMRSELGSQVSDDEKGFLTIHFAAALERQGQTVGVRVLVVCSTGLGSAQLLAARLVRVFKEIQVVGVVSALSSSESASPDQVDLVVTTVALPPLPVPTVRVSPLLGPPEAERIRTAIRTVTGAPSGTEQVTPDGNPMVEGLMAVIPAFAQVRDEQGLRRVLHELLVTQRPPLELIEPIVREVALLGIQIDPAAQAGLAIHLQMALPRYRAGDLVAEPELERMRQEHLSLFRAVERGLQLFGRWHGVTIPPDEVVPVMRYILRPD